MVDFGSPKRGRMSVHVTFTEAEQIIEAHVDDEFNWPVMLELVHNVAKWVNERSCFSVLVITRSIQLDLSTSNIFLVPERLAKEFAAFGIDIRKLRRALVIEDYDQGLRFFETASLNQALTLRFLKMKNQLGLG